jgi:hypothetical protein
MTAAVCFKCGTEKVGALFECESCGAEPKTNAELALSFVLSEHLSSKRQLVHLAHEIRNHLKLSMSEAHLAQAREALKDPQLLAMLRSGRGTPKTAQPKPSQPTGTTAPEASVSNSSENNRKRMLETSYLHRNPFALLGVSTRDDRRRIVELAEEKSLELDHNACQKARSDLTSPRTRLAAEMAWLPGVSPKKASQLAELLLQDPMSIRNQHGLPLLAHLNLMAAAFEGIDGTESIDNIAEFILEIACLLEEVTAEQVLRDINEDRSVSGFPEVKGIELIESEISERKRYYRSAIKDALDRFSPHALVEAMTAAVDRATLDGSDHAPELIDDLVDSYAVETQEFLDKEAENVEQLISAARNAAQMGALAVEPIIDKLVAVARNWDKVAQPIQLSAKARGIDHAPSNQIAYAIRGLAIELFNKHDMLAHSQTLTSLIQELFSELPEVLERSEEDAEALAEIFENRKDAEAQKEQWARDITYRAEVGLVFKDPLSISPDGVSWKSQHYPLNAITRVRWGGVRRSVNGIPTGTSYTIAFGDHRSEAVLELKKESIYSIFIEKLWSAVGFRLLTELLEEMRSGNERRFGEAILRDDGVTLIKHKLFGKDEAVHCSWGQVSVWSADGAFYIGAQDNKKTYASLSYIHNENTHILEQAIRMAFKKPGLRKLSDLLQ